MTYFDSIHVMLLAILTGVGYRDYQLNIPDLGNQPNMSCPEISLKHQPQNLSKIISFRGFESSSLAVLKYKIC